MLAMWVNFAPVLLVLIVHHGFELAHVNEELRCKNSALAEKLKTPGGRRNGRVGCSGRTSSARANLWSSRTDLVICNDGFVT